MWSAAGVLNLEPACKVSVSIVVSMVQVACLHPEPFASCRLIPTGRGGWLLIVRTDRRLVLVERWTVPQAAPEQCPGFSVQ